MKLLFENWRGFLDESRLLKPGPDGWAKYSELVGNAYLRAPKFEQSFTNGKITVKRF